MDRAPYALIEIPPRADRALLPAVIARLREARLRVAGFYQSRDPDQHGRVYLLNRIATGEAIALGRRGGTPAEGEVGFCNVTVRPDAFTAARAWIESDAAAADVLVLDEISRLEAIGEGHARAVMAAREANRPCVLALRADRLAPLVDRFGLDEPAAVLAAGGDLAAFVSAVSALAPAAR